MGKLLAQIPEWHEITYEEAATVIEIRSEADFVVVVRDSKNGEIIETAFL